MEFLKKYKYTLIVLIALSIGGLILNANYYINKRPILPEKRVIKEESNVSYLENTRVWELDKHTEERVLLGYHPDFDWSEEDNFTLSEESTTVTFENIPNFDYGSVTTDIQLKGDDIGVSFSSFEPNTLYRPVYYADVEVTEYVVDVYSMFGGYKYSFIKNVNKVVEDTQTFYYVEKNEAEGLGLN